MSKVVCNFVSDSQVKSSSVSTVFILSISLSCIAPVSPISVAVCYDKMEKSELLIDVFYVFLLLYSPAKPSAVSVVFDFSDSHNDVAPVSPILSPVKRNESQNECAVNELSLLL